MLSADSTFAQIESSSRSGAVLPIGALEQHGRHLALGTDTVIAHALAEKIARELDYYLLPPLPFGTSREHLDFPGTVTLAPNTLAALVTDIAESLRSQKFQTLVIITGHGGNWILKPTIRELNLRPPGRQQGPRIILIDPESWLYPLVDRPGFHHGGEYETALMLHLRPHAVQMNLAPNTGIEPQLHRSLFDYLPVRKLLPHGVWGAPERATSEMGRDLFEKAAANCLDYLRSTLKTLADLDGDPPRQLP